MRRGVLLLALLSLGNASEPLPLRVTVTPVIAQAPSDVHLKVVIERDARNRALQLSIDGERYSQDGVKPVDGAQDQRVWDVWWHSLPCGTYTVAAILTRTDGTQLVERRSVRLLGPPCVEPEEF